MRRSWPVLLVLSLAMGVADRVDAGTVVTVSFSATDANGIIATGSFFYDQSHTVSITSGTFIFQGSLPVHGMSYQIASFPKVVASGAMCSKFNILTTGNGGMLFELDESSSAGCQVVVKIPTSMLSPTSLPFCNVFPMQGGTFTVAGGPHPYSGNITTVSCMQSMVLPAPQDPGEQQCVPTIIAATRSAAAPTLLCQPTATPCAATAARPRRAGCLARLFACRQVRLCRR